MHRTIGDLDVHYEIAGSGPPLVLLHGGGADLIGWENMTPLLSAEATVYSCDLRGFGQTQRPEQGPRLSLDQWTLDLAAFLDAFEIDQPALVGWSLGGSLALNLACEHPARCRAVVAIGSPGPDKVVQDKSGFERRQKLAEGGATVEEIVDATFDFTMAAMSQWTRDHNPTAIGKVREMLLRNDPGDYAEMVDALDGLSGYGPKLARLRARVLVICGDEDSRTPPALSEAIHNKIQGSKLAMIPDCGHSYAHEKPEETCRLVLDFLRSA